MPRFLYRVIRLWHISTGGLVQWKLAFALVLDNNSHMQLFLGTWNAIWHNNKIAQESFEVLCFSSDWLWLFLSYTRQAQQSWEFVWVERGSLSGTVSSRFQAMRHRGTAIENAWWFYGFDDRICWQCRFPPEIRTSQPTSFSPSETTLALGRQLAVVGHAWTCLMCFHGDLHLMWWSVTFFVHMESFFQIMSFVFTCIHGRTEYSWKEPIAQQKCCYDIHNKAQFVAKCFVWLSE